MTVLMWGVPSESPMALVAGALSALGTDVVWAHPSRSGLCDVEIRFDDRLDVVLTIEGRTLGLDDLTGIYLRPVDPDAVPELAAAPFDDPRRAHARRVHDSLLAVTELAARFSSCRVLNPLSAMASNVSKPFQAQAVLKAGFATPDTLVSDAAEEVLAFAARHGEVIYKSTSGIRSIVTAFDPQADHERLARLRWCPVQFQERIAGPDVRVHVIGERTFAAMATTTAVDYRYARAQVGADATLAAYELDDDIAERCVGLAETLGLPFAGIDLKLCPDGRVVCFEVNPSPGFSWYEQEAGLPISEAVAHYLTGTATTTSL